MKRFVYTFFLLLLLSCNSFLDAELNKSLITTDKVFGSDVTATAAVTAIYYTISANSGLSSTPSGMNVLAGLAADELSNYGQDPNLIVFQQHAVSPLNPNIQNLWSSIYNIIYQANAVIEGIDQSTVLTPSIARQLRGEAMFIRAFSYFYLVNLFGDVPLVLNSDYQKNEHLSRRPIDEVYGLIESDLTAAQSLLAGDYPTPQRVRPNQSTPTALLARLYLYRQQYSKAEERASVIIANSFYRLTTSADINKTFLIDSQETIWQLMPVIPNSNTVEASTFIVTTTPSYHVLRGALLNHFELADARRNNWINSYNNAIGTYYFPYKYKQNAKNPKDNYGEASIVFRLAEMYLIRAEARAQLGKLVGANSALSDLNIIRERAGLPDLAINDKQTLLLAIENERWSELFTEYGHRWLDLKRSGRALEVLGNGITQEHLLWPIPAAEFIKNSSLGQQNPGY